MVVAVLVLLLFLPALLLPPGTSSDLAVTFYDKDGNPVGLPLGFVGSSGPVDSVGITLSYTVTSSSARFEENLEVWGNVLIEWRVTGGTWATAYDLPVSSNRLATGSWSWTYNLRDIIVVDDAGKASGWEVRITSSLTARTTMAEGEIVTSAPSTDSAFFTLGWETPDLVVTGVVEV